MRIALIGEHTSLLLLWFLLPSRSTTSLRTILGSTSDSFQWVASDLRCIDSCRRSGICSLSRRFLGGSAISASLCPSLGRGRFWRLVDQSRRLGLDSEQNVPELVC